jgi:hypothetical protein
MSAPAAFGGFNVFDPNTASKTAGPLDLYVSGDTGDDNNDGLTPATALETITEAESRIPDVICEASHRVIIHVGTNSDDDPYDMPTFRSRVLRADIFIVGDGAGVGDGYAALGGVGASGSAGGGSTTELLDFAAGGMTVNAFRGKVIEILTGTSAGDFRLINENTASGIIPSRPFRGVPDGTYRIVEPANGLLAPDPGQVWFDGDTIIRNQSGTQIDPGSPVHWLINFQIDASGVGAGSSTIVAQAPVNMYGIDSSLSTKRINFETVASVIGRGSAAVSDAPADAGLVSDIDEWDGYGWGAELTDSFLEITGQTTVGQLDLVAVRTVVVGHVLLLSDGSLEGGDLRRTDASNNSPILLFGRTFILGPSATLPVKIRAVSVGISVGTLLSPANNAQTSLIFVDVDCGGSSVGVCLLNQGSTVVRVGTYVSDHIGLRCERGVVEINDADPTITATTAELSFDGATGVPQSLLLAEGDVIDGANALFVRIS